MSFLAAMPLIGAATKVAGSLFSRRNHEPSAASFEHVLQQTRGMQFVTQRDTDGDGALSAAEFSGDANLFAAWDTNGDGKLSSAEIDAGMNLSRQWQLLDSDRDGALTQHELGATRDAFAQVDGDGDGRVSRREFHHAYGAGERL